MSKGENMIDLEKKVLSIMFHNEQERKKGLAGLDILDFTSEYARVIFAKMFELDLENQPISLIANHAFVTENKISMKLLNEILDYTVNFYLTPEIIDNLKQNSKRTRLIQMLRKNLIEIEKDHKSFDETIAEIENTIGNFGVNNSYLIPIKDSAVRLYEEFEEIHINKSLNKKYIGLETGIESLDIVLNGLQKGHLLIIAGLSGSGKSVFLTNIVFNLIKQNKHVLFVSTEMRDTEIVARMVAMECGQNIYTNYTLQEKDIEAVSNTLNKLSKTNVTFNYKNFDVDKIYQDAKLLQKQEKLDLLVVDYLQQLEVTGENMIFKENTLIKYISKKLKLIAQKLEIPVIAVSQFSKSADARERVNVADLYGSASIRQDADNIALIEKIPKSVQEERKQMGKQYANIIINTPKVRQTGANELIYAYLNPATYLIEERI